MNKTLKYRLACVLLFTALPFFILANVINYKDLPDSSRLQIRLKSFLLVGANEKLPDTFFDSRANIPVAFTVDDVHSAALLEQIRICSPNQSQILLISNKSPLIPGDIQSEIIVCNPDEIDSLVCSSDTIDPQLFESFLSENELLKVTVNDSNCREACFDLWKKTGKLPHFIYAKPSGIREAANIVSALNSTAKIYGVTWENGKLLQEVYWENTEAKTYGYFSFPLKAYNNYLIPYKPGYRFSPGIIYQSTSNADDMKTFNGIKYEPDSGLEDHFTFQNKVKNEKWENTNGLITNHVKFRKDKKFGGVAVFENRSYIDAGPQSTEMLSSKFSIIAWIKVDDSDGKYSILGKGENFNLGIYHGNLTFSMAIINDFISEKSPVPVGVWTQVAMVYSEINNRIYFYVNGIQTDQIDLISKYEASDYTLLIGNNLWEEFFTGEMGEIKIWNRELDKDEIYYHYLNPSGKNDFFLPGLAAFIIILIGVTTFLFIKKRRQPKKHTDTLKIRHTEIPLQKVLPESERIVCFGGLKVFDATGTEVSLKFSPKLKQLFTLILLHSHGNNKGITSKQLAEILWPGANVSNTKNIRSTYVQNLRLSLASFKHIELVFSNKRWFFDCKENFYNEFAQVDTILSRLVDESNKQVLEAQLPSLIAILKKGRFLEGIEELWLDPFIEKMNNRIIEFCLSMFSILDNREHNTLLFDLAEIISLIDPLNESALQKKINLLIDQGKLSLANNIYTNFVKLYKELYQEDYSIDFKVLCKKTPGPHSS